VRAPASLADKLTRLQELMRHQVPDGDLATLLEIAITEKIQRLEARRMGRTQKPRTQLHQADPTPRTRHIPAAIRRAVYERDGDQCTFVDERGVRCTERGMLELHHAAPYGRRGTHDPENLHVMCRAHDDLLAERDYGKRAMRRHRSKAREMVAPWPGRLTHSSLAAAIEGIPSGPLATRGGRAAPGRAHHAPERSATLRTM